MKNYFSIKKIIEAELKIDMCDLIKDDSFKALLKYSIRKQLDPIDASSLLLGYLKENYIGV